MYIEVRGQWTKSKKKAGKEMKRCGRKTEQRRICIHFILLNILI